MSPERTTPRVYVACLHCYNSGSLHGEWFDVGTDPGELCEAVLRFFGAGCAACETYDGQCLDCYRSAARLPCGGEELAVHDHEGLGDHGEAWDPIRLCALAAIVEDFPEKPALAYLSLVDGDVEQAAEGLRERYFGVWDTRAEWAEEWAELSEAGRERLLPYVDWDRYARDLELGGGFMTIRDAAGLHVFFS